MARGRGRKLSITQLQQILESRQEELNELYRERAELQRKLLAVEREIVRLGGPGARDDGPHLGRVRNEKSLIETIDEVLGEAGKPMRVSDISDAVLGTGYKTHSGNFRGIVNQTLIKDRRFVPAARGWYQLRKEPGRVQREKVHA